MEVRDKLVQLLRKLAIGESCGIKPEDLETSVEEFNAEVARWRAGDRPRGFTFVAGVRRGRGIVTDDVDEMIVRRFS